MGKGKGTPFGFLNSISIQTLKHPFAEMVVRGLGMGWCILINKGSDSN